MTLYPPEIGDILWTIARPADDHIDEEPGHPRIVEVHKSFKIDSHVWYEAYPHSLVTGKTNRDPKGVFEMITEWMFDRESDAWEGYAAEMREMAAYLRTKADQALREAWTADQAVDRLMGGN